MELGRFTEVRDGVPLEFRITTVPPRLSEAVVQHMTTFYLPREPMCSHYKFFEDPVARGLVEETWRGQIAAGNALSIKGTAVEKPYDAAAVIAERAQIFEKYSVDSYLKAFGLSVHPDYHGYKLGERLLQARKPLCKAIGIKVTASIFTSVKALHLSKKVGFVVLYEEEYSKYTYNDIVPFHGMPGKFQLSAWEFQ